MSDCRCWVLRRHPATNGLSAYSGGYFWDDGATGGYDGIDQTFATTPGDTYDVSFYLAEVNSNGFATPGNDYQQTCTNGLSGTDCNGIDVAGLRRQRPATDHASVVRDRPRWRCCASRSAAWHWCGATAPERRCEAGQSGERERPGALPL